MSGGCPGGPGCPADRGSCPGGVRRTGGCPGRVRGDVCATVPKSARQTIPRVSTSGQVNSAGFRRNVNKNRPKQLRRIPAFLIRLEAKSLRRIPADSGGMSTKIGQSKSGGFRRIPADSGGFRRIPAELTYTGTQNTWTMGLTQLRTNVTL